MTTDSMQEPKAVSKQWKKLPSSFDKHEIPVHEWVSGSPIASIMFIHGLGEHVMRYDDFFSQLADCGFSVYGPDHRGHGTACEPKKFGVASWPGVVSDIVTVAKDLPEDKPIIFYGHSMGGCLLLEIMRKNLFPMAIYGALVSAPFIEATHPLPGFKVFMGKVLGTLLPNVAMENELKPEQLSRDVAVQKAVVDDPLCHTKISLGFGKAFLASANDTKTWSPSALEYPVHFLHGSKDEICSPTASKELFDKIQSDKTYKLYEEMFHECHFDTEKQMVWDDIKNVLAKFLEEKKKEEEKEEDKEEKKEEETIEEEKEEEKEQKKEQKKEEEKVEEEKIEEKVEEKIEEEKEEEKEKESDS